MTRFSYALGAVLALLAAGPICITIVLVGSLFLDGPGTGNDASGLIYLVPIMIFSIPFGMAIAALPVLIAGYGLGRVGVSQPTARHHLVWVLAGAAIGLCMALAIGPDWRGGSVFAATGALCALIVRYGTRWFDEASA